MTQTFFGPWSVDVVALNAGYAQQLVVSGSNSADGAYPATPGFHVDVDGDRWTLDLEWNDGAGSGWRASDVRKRAEYTIGAGLVITLGADDNFDAVRDYDYDDVTVALRSLDPEVDPPATDPPLEFTITRDQLWKPDDRRWRRNPDRPRRPDPPTLDRPHRPDDPRRPRNPR